MNQIQTPPVTVLLDRISVIEALSRESTESQQFKYRGTMQPLPIVRVHLGLPIYRTANHRTKTLQEEYLAKHPDLPKSFLLTNEYGLNRVWLVQFNSTVMEKRGIQ